VQGVPAGLFPVSNDTAPQGKAGLKVFF
jgi:hypothetical protein